MIGIDRKTGQRIDGLAQLISRITQVMTTPFGGRAKRPRFGSRVREHLAANMTDSMLLLTQSAALEAFYNPINGLQDFIPSRCLALRRQDGISLYFQGRWQDRQIEFEVPLDVSPSQSTAETGAAHHLAL